MRIDLIILGTLAASALAGLVDAARRAAAEHEESDLADASSGLIPVAMLRARIEEMEKRRAGVDAQAPLALLVMAMLLAVVSLGVFTELGHAELASLLLAVSLGLSIASVAWARDARRCEASLSVRVSTLRACLAQNEPRTLRPFDVRSSERELDEAGTWRSAS